MASKNKQMMARTAEEYAEDIATTAEIVRGWAKQMFEDAVNRRYRKVRDTAQKIGQTMTRFDAELAKPIIASRPGEKDMMAASDMTTPEAIAKMMEAWNKIEAQAKKQFPNASKEELYRITKSAFESALKFKFSRPGAKATFKIEDGFYFGKGRKERFADDRLAKFLDVYNRNEDNNYHSENVVLLAKFLGSTDDVAQAQRIANEQRRSSDGISEKLYKERTELNRRLLSKFRSRYPQADI